MGYPIMTPSFYKELIPDARNPESGPKCDVIISPAAVEYVFSLSSTEVVKKLMSITEPLAYSMVNMNAEQENLFDERIQAKVARFPVLKYYWQIRMLIMNILQNKNFSFEKRMLILNYAMKTVDGMVEKGQPELIPQFVNQFINLESYDNILEYFKTIKPVFEVALGEGIAFLKIFNKTPAFKKIMNTIYKNLGVSGPETLSTVDINKYITLKKDFMTSVIKGKEHYIENIMINYVWSLSMPFAASGISLWDNYVFFGALFNAVKVMLTCYMSGKNDDEFAQAIAEFDTAFRGEGIDIISKAIKASKNAGNNNNGDLAILIVS